MGLKELKERTEKNPVYVVFTFAVAAAGIAWAASEKIQVAPREREIGSLRQQVAELKAANEPGQKQIQELSAKNIKLENDLEASRNNLIKTQDTLKARETNYLVLEKNINRCEANGNIFSEIRKLEERKAPFDARLTTKWGLRTIKSGEKPEPYIPTFHEIQWQRQSDELQARIVDLQQRLHCQPK